MFLDVLKISIGFMIGAFVVAIWTKKPEDKRVLACVDLVKAADDIRAAGKVIRLDLPIEIRTAK